MITEIIKKDFSYTKRVNVSFLIIISVLTFCTACIVLVNYNYLKSIIEKENENFVHNMAIFYLEHQIRPLENAIWEVSNQVSRYNVDTFIAGKDNALKNSLMASLSVMPIVTNIVITDKHGKFNTVPNSDLSGNFEPKNRPWFEHFGGKNSVVNYTDLYVDMIDNSSIITMSKKMMDKAGLQYGLIALDLNLKKMSYPLRQLKSTARGRYFVVDRVGRVILDSDTDLIGKKVVSEHIVNEMTSGLGTIYDAINKTHHYYYSFTSPDWFMIFSVNENDLSSLSLFDSKIILVSYLLCVSIYLMIWYFMNQSIKGMIIDIVSMLRFGRSQSKVKADKQIIDEIIESNNEIKKARDISLTDGLTGILNRRSFDNDIEFLVLSETPFTLAIIDIDNFKHVNDHYGHLVGDMVIKVIAQIGLSVLDNHSRIYRYGGEEIAFINFSGDMKKSANMLEKWRIQTEQKEWREHDLKVTFSGGLCAVHKGESTTAIAEADKLLYQAKSSGKNKIVIASH